MTKKPKRLFINLLCLLVLAALVGPPASAQINGFGQFHVGRVGGGSDAATSNKVTNPTRRTMFYFALLYWPDGTLDTTWGAGGCAGGVLFPHSGLTVPSATNNQRCDSGTDDVGCADERRKTLEVVAVPTEGPSRGVFGGSLNLGVMLHMRKNGIGKSVSPDNFHLPTGATKAQVIACACSQMADYDVSNDTMNEVGIFCP